MATANPEKAKNEVKIGGNTRIGGALRYIYGVLVEEKEHRFVVLRGAGIAISIVVPLAELIRRRIPGIHQNTEITTIEQEETNRDGEKYIRNLTMLKVTLSLDPLDTDTPGYAAPLPDSEVTPFDVTLTG